MKDFAIKAFDESAEVKRHFARDHADKIVQVAQLIGRAFQTGHKVLLFGNGGSATDAAHIAAEFVGRYKRERVPFPAIALATDIAAITCIANDYGFDELFARQVRAHGQAGDVAIAISTSGNSPNVLRAAEVAREKNMHVIGLTGKDGGRLADLCTVEVRVPHQGYADRVQEVHIKVIHALIDHIERDLAQPRRKEH